MALWPMLDQMNPDASTMAEASLEVDLSSLMPGQALTVLWRRKPVFIRYRTAAELAAARAVAVESLRDIYARNPSLPEQADASEIGRASCRERV